MAKDWLKFKRNSPSSASSPRTAAAFLTEDCRTVTDFPDPVLNIGKASFPPAPLAATACPEGRKPDITLIRVKISIFLDTLYQIFLNILPPTFELLQLKIKLNSIKKKQITWSQGKGTSMFIINDIFILLCVSWIVKKKNNEIFLKFLSFISKPLQIPSTAPFFSGEKRKRS